jgi:hypothetical protein
MRLMLITPLCAALAGSVTWQVALAQQKTAKECSSEWAAEKAAIQATGKTKRVFIAECRGLPATSKVTPSPALASGQFRSEAEAKASCPADDVVWVNLKSRISHSSGSASYGATRAGAYMCRSDSAAAGFRPPRNLAKADKPA